MFALEKAFILMCRISREIIFSFNSKTQRQMFPLLHGRHVCVLQIYSGAVGACRPTLHRLYECQLPCPSRTDRWKRRKSTETRKNESSERICFSFPCHQEFPRKRVSVEAFCAYCLHCLPLSCNFNLSYFFQLLLLHFAATFQK